jgi:hypothetical protein
MIQGATPLKEFHPLPKFEAVLKEALDRTERHEWLGSRTPKRRAVVRVTR